MSGVEGVETRIPIPLRPNPFERAPSPYVEETPWLSKAVVDALMWAVPTSLHVRRFFSWRILEDVQDLALAYMRESLIKEAAKRGRAVIILEKWVTSPFSVDILKQWDRDNDDGVEIELTGWTVPIKGWDESLQL